MPRKPREEVEGGIHHVWARGNNREPIFLTDVDRQVYLRMLGGVVRRQGWRCLSYCLMDNHVHLLIETPRPNLAEGMRRLHGLYAQDFNLRTRRCGHVFQGRYGSRLVRTDEELWGVVGYIARNPVSAGLCESPGDWPWSSHVQTLNGAAPEWLDAKRLLDFFSPAGGTPARRYAEATA